LWPLRVVSLVLWIWWVCQFLSWVVSRRPDFFNHFLLYTTLSSSHEQDIWFMCLQYAVVYLANNVLVWVSQCQNACAKLWLLRRRNWHRCGCVKLRQQISIIAFVYCAATYICAYNFNLTRSFVLQVKHIKAKYGDYFGITVAGYLGMWSSSVWHFACPFLFLIDKKMIFWCLSQFFVMQQLWASVWFFNRLLKVYSM
jgi:hypothetical protein